MNLFPDQVSAAGARHLDAQLQLFRNAASSALDGVEQFAALQFSTTRGAVEKSTELLRQVAAARDPRDLLALMGHSRSHMDTVLAYQSKLFGIATAMSGAIAGLPPVLTPAASAALQKLASLPPVSTVTATENNDDDADADDIVEHTADLDPDITEPAAPAEPDEPVPVEPASDAGPEADDIVEHTADLDPDIAEPAEPAAPAPVEPASAAEPEADDIIEQTNEVVEELAAGDDAAAAPPTTAPDSAAPSEPGAASGAAPIATLSAVAAATGHETPHPSAAPMIDAGAPVQVGQVQPVDAQAPVSVAKPAGRQRKK